MERYLTFIFSFLVLWSSLAGFSAIELEEAYNSNVTSHDYVDLNGNGKFDLDSEEDESAESETNSQAHSLFFVSPSKMFSLSTSLTPHYLNIYFGVALDGHSIEIFYPPRSRTQS